MRNVKYRMEPYQLYDYQGVERHLEDMASKGWRLESIGWLFWKYRRAEPANIRYAVTYGQDISQFDPAPTEAQKSLEELCTSAGWEKAAEWSQMLIFSTEDPDPVPLETDGAILLDVIHRSMKASYIPANILLLVIYLFMSASSISTLLRDPLRFFDNNIRLLSLVLGLLLAALLLSNMGAYFLWRRRSLKSVAQGGDCASIGPGYRRVGKTALVLLALIILAFILMELRSSESLYAIVFPIYTAAFFALILILRRTSEMMKKRGASRGTNMAVTLAVDCVLAIAIVLAMTFAVLRLHRIPGPETYVTPGGVWDVNPVELPLDASDLTGETYRHARHTAVRSGSVFLPIQKYWDMSYSDREQEIVDVSFEIWDPKFNWLRGALLDDLLSVHQDWPYSPVWQETDPSAWGAERAWRKSVAGGEMEAWLLSWPGRVVCFSCTWELDEAQKGLIRDTFAP